MFARRGSACAAYRFFDEDPFRSPWSPYPDFVFFFAGLRRSTRCDRPCSSISLNRPEDLRFAKNVPARLLTRVRFALDFFAADLRPVDLRAVDLRAVLRPVLFRDAELF